MRLFPNHAEARDLNPCREVRGRYAEILMAQFTPGCQPKTRLEVASKPGLHARAAGEAAIPAMQSA